MRARTDDHSTTDRCRAVSAPGLVTAVVPIPSTTTQIARAVLRTSLSALSGSSAAKSSASRHSPSAA